MCCRNGIIPTKRVWVASALVILAVLHVQFDASDLAAIQQSLLQVDYYHQALAKTEVNNNQVAFVVETGATMKGATTTTSSNSVEQHDVSGTLPLGSARRSNPGRVSNNTNASGSHSSSSTRNSPPLKDFGFNSHAGRKGVKPTKALANVKEAPKQKAPNFGKDLSSKVTKKAKSTAVPPPRVPATPKLVLGSRPVLSARTAKPQQVDTTTKIRNGSSSIVIPHPLVCRRRCQHFNNKVFLVNPSKGGGLNDRLFLIPRMLQLSSYLCARLYLARPKFWLSASHNQGKELDVRITWDDFESFRLLDDKTSNSSAFVDWVNEGNLTMPPNIINIQRSRKYRSWLYIRTDNITANREHFEKIEAFSFSQDHNSSSQQPPFKQDQQQQGFLWEIRADYYDVKRFLIYYMGHRNNISHANYSVASNKNQRFKIPSSNWRREMQPAGFLPNDGGCNYIQRRNPRDVVRLVNQIFERITTDDEPNHNDNGTTTLAATPPPSSPKPWIGYFHIRRGDAIAACDTTLKRIERFLECSVGRPLSRLASTSKGQLQPKRQVILLLSSDERSLEYRQALSRLVEKQTFFPMVNQTFTVSFADLDELGRSEIAAAIEKGEMPAWRQSNMYLFRLIMYIEWSRREIMFRLEQRRSTCPSCNSIIPQLQWKRALSDYF